METIQITILLFNSLLSITLEHAPKFSTWWHGLASRDRSIMILVIAGAVAGAVNMLACYTDISAMPCVDFAGIVEYFLYSLLGLLGTHSLFKRR